MVCVRAPLLHFMQVLLRSSDQGVVMALAHQSAFLHEQPLSKIKGLTAPAACGLERFLVNGVICLVFLPHSGMKYRELRKAS